MKLRRVLLVTSVAACLLLAVGCAGPQPDGGAAAPEAPAAGGGMMGGSSGDAGGDIMLGVIAVPDAAAIEVPGSAGTSAGLTVSRVMAPVDGWVVVRSTLPPGIVLGAARVPAGESRDVTVKLTSADGAPVRVALHADRGRPGVLEFDPEAPERAADKPVFAAEKAVQRIVALKSYGIDTVPNAALLMVDAQPGARKAVRVRYLLVPGPSWIVVQTYSEGRPGRRVGVVAKALGEYQEIDVPLDGSALTPQVVVSVLADRGERGRLDFREDDPLGSADQPWRSAGVMLSERVAVR